MSAGTPVVRLPDGHGNAFMRELAAFFTGALSDELRGTYVNAEVRRGMSGYELRLDFRFHSVLCVDENKLPKTDAEKPQWLADRGLEAECLAANMKAAIHRYADGKGDE